LLNPPPWLHLLSLALLNLYTVLSPLLFAFRSRRVQRDIARLLGTTRSRRNQGANFRKMRSYSCPQLVLTACTSLPGPAASPAQIHACRSYADMANNRRMLPSLSLFTPSDTDQWGDHSQSSQAGQTYNWGASERTPCISVTAPDDNEEEGKRKEEEGLRMRGRQSMDSGYSSPLCPALPPLSPHHLDVSL